MEKTGPLGAGFLFLTQKTGETPENPVDKRKKRDIMNR